MRIAYCLNTVKTYGGGGIDRVTIEKANALAEIKGNEVYIIVTDNPDSYHLACSISPKVHFVDLDINYYDTYSILQMLKKRHAKKQLHRKRLIEVLNKISPDIVVSTGMAEKNILPSIPGRWKTIREFHWAKLKSLPKIHTRWERFVYRVSSWKDYYNVWKYNSIVSLTQEDKQKGWNNNPHVEVIPNPISFTCKETAVLENKKVIAVGRLVEQKDFASLIRAFKTVADKHTDWTLEIYGDGSLRWSLQQQIKDLKLENNVFLKGYTSDVQGCMLESSIFAFSSIYEGFGLVLTEAMMCGLPVVSYACPCGPKDIISEGKDGFLVPVGDEAALADRICRLIEDKELRLCMGKAAKEKANQYRIENIIPMWMDLFHRLLKN